MKYNVFKERDNTVYCFGHPMGLNLPKMLSPTDNKIFLHENEFNSSGESDSIVMPFNMAALT
jgi:hypothetical protein